VFSHVDADGIAAAGIMGKSLRKLGGKVRIRAVRWVDANLVDQIAAEKPSLTILTDAGSGYLDLLGEKLSESNVIILDHHQPVADSPSTFIQVNPHLHEIEGSIDISGAGVAYLVAKALDKTNIELAYLAVLGALGDMQDKYTHRSLGGANENIVKDAEKAGALRLETDLLFFGRETRPIHQALARTTTPFIPKISGQEGNSFKFLKDLGINSKEGDKWRALTDLSDEEKKKLFSALAEHLASEGFSGDVALNLIGYVYTLVNEERWSPLRDAREFTTLLNATGRMGKPGLGVSICMGDRDVRFEEVLKEYRLTITKYLRWVNENPERLEELGNIYVLRGAGVIDEKVLSPVSSILSTSLRELGKPILAYTTIPEERKIKVSARALEPLKKQGLNLGAILSTAAERFSGRGGGHDVAAGAQVPIEDVDSFINLVDELVKRQLAGAKIGG
jgi:RecJ-like exonuclease